MTGNAKTSVPEALRSFDDLPDSAYVREPVVAGLFACSGRHVWRNVQSGRIPQPKKLSPRVTGWNVGELRKALATV